MTTAILERDAMTETYEDMKNLIFDTTWSFQRIHGGDIEELIAEANKIFVLAYNSYNDELSKFSTWLVYKIERDLRRFNQIEWRQSHPFLNRIPEHYPYREYEYAETYSVIDLLDEMGKDSEIILRLFVETPKEVFTTALRERRHMQNSIRNRLRQMGWTIKRLTESFEEISKALQS